MVRARHRTEVNLRAGEIPLAEIRRPVDRREVACRLCPSTISVGAGDFDVRPFAQAPCPVIGHMNLPVASEAPT